MSHLSKNVITRHKANKCLGSLVMMTFLIFGGLFFVNLGNTGLFDVDEAILDRIFSEFCIGK